MKFTEEGGSDGPGPGRGRVAPIPSIEVEEHGDGNPLPQYLDTIFAALPQCGYPPNTSPPQINTMKNRRGDTPSPPQPHHPF